ncbi:MAG: DUF1801 domain-containing protein [Williamsia sp.]|nr:DUF1801 domain-containing protein [Williamsia sp.]
MKDLHPYTDTDSYIAGFPENTQRLLHEIRRTIREAAPEAAEKISYGIPTFTMGGNLVHFAAYDHHIGFYPGSSPVKAFEKELAGYKTSRGTVQFPLDKPLPHELISKIVQHGIAEIKAKKKKK